MACLDSGSCDITSASFTVEGDTWHKVTVTAKGYQPWSEDVYVTSDQTIMVLAYLDLDPNVTVVKVIIRPGGGIIWLDNSDCRANVGANSTSGSTLFKGVSEGYHPAGKSRSWEGHRSGNCAEHVHCPGDNNPGGATGDRLDPGLC